MDREECNGWESWYPEKFLDAERKGKEIVNVQSLFVGIEDVIVGCGRLDALRRYT